MFRFTYYRTMPISPPITPTLPSRPFGIPRDFSNLGSFDEDSARFFLREVGRRVVPCYPFALGMEEVYCLILENFGFDGIPDITSVLQELLEEDGSSDGAGDDGDIWRSWRYSWKHRNDDSLNPFMPRIGRMILPAPTPRQLRHIKAENFLLEQQRRSLIPFIVNEDSNHDINAPPRTASTVQTSTSRTSALQNTDATTIGTGTTYSHQRLRPRVSQEQNTSEEERPESFVDTQAACEPQPNRQSRAVSIATGNDSQQDFVEVTASMLDSDFDPSLQLSFEMLDSSRPFQPGSGRASDTPGQICTLQQVSPTRNVAAHGAHDDIAEAPSNDSSAAFEGPHNPLSSPERITEADDNIESLTALHPSLPDSETLISQSTPEQTPDFQRRRTRNRHVRLIDGSMFPFRGRKSTTTRASTEASSTNPGEVSRPGPSWRTWMPGRQKRESRGSWLHSIRSLFRSNQNKSSNRLTRKPHRSHSTANPFHSQFNTTTFHRRATSDTGQHSRHMQQSNAGLFLDGACDIPSKVSAGSTSNLNKPLPLNPDEILRVLNSGSRTSSSSLFPNPSKIASSASTVSTKLSQTGSKSAFTAITKDLMNEGNMEPFKLSPVQEPEPGLMLQPLKYDPKKTPPLPTIPYSYGSIARQNPFTDAPVPLVPLSRSSSQIDRDHEFKAGFPTSSINNGANESVTYATYKNLANQDFESLPQTPPSSNPENWNTITTHARGRSKSRSEGVGLTHQSPLASKKDPLKRTRSRSPVKRFLGIGKSTPPPEQDKQREDPRTPTKVGKGTEISPLKPSPAPNSKNKSSLKQLSHRLRHGFLSADPEEVQREAQIDSYMEDAAPPKALDPSKFPISIDPAYQARLQSDTEVMIVITANRFLLREAKAGRISAESVNRMRKEWERRNFPQVLEYQFDQTTQRDLIVANLSTIEFCGAAARDPVFLNSVLYAWGTLASEMKIRTYCSGDSAIRKHLNDARNILEMLGAPLVSILHFEDIQMKALTYMHKRQKERVARKKAADGSHAQHSRTASGTSEPGIADFLPLQDASDPTQTWYHQHQRNISDGSYGQAAEEAFNGDFKGIRISPRPMMPVSKVKNKKVMHLRQVSDPRDFSSGTYSRGAEDRIQANMARMELQNGPARRVREASGPKVKSLGYAQAAKSSHG